MRIGIITDISLHQRLRQMEHQGEISVLYALDDMNSNIDVLVIDNKYIPINLFIKFIENNSKPLKYLFILSEESETSHDISLLTKKGVKVLPSILTEDQIAEIIYDFFYSNKDMKS